MTEETAPTTKLILNVPTRQSPGFVARQVRLLELMELRDSFTGFGADATIEQIRAMRDGFLQIVDFLADYVEAPNHEAAVALVKEASEEQFDVMFDALAGASKQLPPEQNQ